MRTLNFIFVHIPFFSRRSCHRYVAGKIQHELREQRMQPFSVWQRWNFIQAVPSHKFLSWKTRRRQQGSDNVAEKRARVRDGGGGGCEAGWASLAYLWFSVSLTEIRVGCEPRTCWNAPRYDISYIARFRRVSCFPSVSRLPHIALFLDWKSFFGLKSFFFQFFFICGPAFYAHAGIVRSIGSVFVLEFILKLNVTQGCLFYTVEMVWFHSDLFYT